MKWVLIIPGALVIVLIALIRYIKKAAKWKEYTSFRDCYGFYDWYKKNEDTWERERFDYVVSIVVATATSVITTFYLLKK